MQELQLLSSFKKQNPWAGTYEIKYHKFHTFLVNLCDIYQINCPKFLVPKNKNLKWMKDRHGDCRISPPRIRIKYFSVIDLLHEFKHLIDSSNKDFHKDLNKREWDAIYYSNLLFYITWPERIKKINEIVSMNNSISRFKEILNIKDPHYCAIIDSIEYLRTNELSAML